MTRALAVIATVVLGVVAVASTAAEACISCEYVPEVVNTPVPSQEKSYRKSKPHKSVERRRTTAKRKDRSQHTKITKKTAPSEAVPAEVKATKEAMTETTTVKADARGEAVQPPSQEVKAEEALGCRKYSPAAGTTIAVPCE